MDLLQRLGQHRLKCYRRPTHDDTDDVLDLTAPGALRRKRLLDSRQLFESGLLALMLSCAGLEITDLEEELRSKLATLLFLLDEVVNPSLLHGASLQTGRLSQEQEYPQLELLLDVLDSSDGPFYLATSHTSSLFRIENMSQGEAANAAVKHMNHMLDGLRYQSSRSFSKTTRSSRTRGVDASERSSFVQDYNIEFLRGLLGSIDQAFQACNTPEGGKSPHKLMLQLHNVEVGRSDHTVGLDAFISCPNVDPAPATESWQRVQYCSESGTASGIGCDQFCKHIQYSLQDQEGLMLFYNINRATFRPSPRAFPLPSTDLTRYPPVSLRDLLEIDGAFDEYSWTSQPKEPFTVEERRTIAAKLALNMAIFCSLKHTSKPWNRDWTRFLRTSPTTYDRTTPYIVCHVGRIPDESFGTTKNLAPLSIFTDLAELLLEIEYGRTAGEVPNVDGRDKYLRVKDHLDFHTKIKDLSREQYLEAVNSCLRFHRIFYAERLTPARMGESEDMTRMDLIYTKIVSKIVRETATYQPAPTRGSSLRMPAGKGADRLLSFPSMNLDNDCVGTRWSVVAPSNQRYSDMHKAAQRLGQDSDRNSWHATHNDQHGRQLGMGIKDMSNSDSLANSVNNERVAGWVTGLSSSSHEPQQLHVDGSRFDSAMDGYPDRPVHNARQSSADKRTPDFRQNNDDIERWMTRLSSSKAQSTVQWSADHGRADSAGEKPPVSATEERSRPPRMSVQFFSVNLQGSINEEKRKGTAKWIAELKALRRTYKIGRNKYTDLKIAILDSGIDMNHEMAIEEDAEGRIVHESFVEGVTETDECGHGTHVAGIILSLTSRTKIYVAKIMSSNQATEAEEASVRSNIVQALRRARNDWKVDMITMSFGYSRLGTPDEVGLEISQCLNQGISVFASASNEGGNNPRTYPGRYPRVLCIHSSNSTGNASFFNPSKEDKEDNWSTVGEYVKSWWPEHMPNNQVGTDDGWKHLSGTSFATPVAVSIAACMIGYIRTHLSEYRWHISPTSSEGIRRMFKLMRDDRGDGYDWLSPQYFFSRFRQDQIIADLKSDHDGLGGYIPEPVGMLEESRLVAG